jgi:hypothetical protein
MAMTVKQISVFLENKRGRLAEVTAILNDRGINIRALALADTADFGVLRIIVTDPEACLGALRERGFIAQATEVIAVEIPDRPGGLNSVLRMLDAGAINIEYMYAFVERLRANAVVIFKIDDPARAIRALTQEGVPILTEEALKSL